MVMQAPSPCSSKPAHFGRRQAAFTLIEMLVVMSIIALLLTIAVPRYFGSLRHSRELVLKDSLAVLRASIDSFHSDRGRYPVDLKELAEQHYIRAIPFDPITESKTTWVTIPAPDADTPGIVDVHSGAPGASPDGEPYAKY